MMEPVFYVYILASGYMGTLYIGHTDNLEQRIVGHKTKTLKGFTSRYNITRLVYIETYPSREEAFKHERQLKHYLRIEKIKLIERENPHWADIASSWHNPQ